MVMTLQSVVWPAGSNYFFLKKTNVFTKMARKHPVDILNVKSGTISYLTTGSILFYRSEFFLNI